MKKLTTFLLLAALLILTGCVSKPKFTYERSIVPVYHIVDINGRLGAADAYALTSQEDFIRVERKRKL